MSDSREICITENYIYDRKVGLGKGATSIVYLGRHRKTGSLVAVKQFSINYRDYYAKNTREIDVLKVLKHENTVKLIAIEPELDPHGKDKSLSENDLIIMEYCSGGSLQEKIFGLECKFGLNDTEYLNLLKCLKNGLDYLRSKDICHRDIKPGNIMLHKSSTGEIVYKFVDFGAARTLQEGQEFTSLVGTEEYLSPAMYRKAVLGKNSEHDKFCSVVDLWSLGVTLYQAATGELPFKPYGYKRDPTSRHKLYEMCTMKATGVISGIENDSKQTKWFKELPAKCALSVELKSLVTPLLQGLLESNNDRVWSFDQFFKIAEEIIAHKLIKVFQPLTGELRLCYLKPPNVKCSTETIHNITEKIVDIWGVKSFLLFHSGQIFIPQNQPLETGLHSGPIVCAIRSGEGVVSNQIVSEFPWPNVKPLQVTQVSKVFDYVRDVKTEMHHLCLKANSLRERATLFETFVIQFHGYIQEQIKKINLKMPYFLSLLRLSIEVGRNVLTLQQNYALGDTQSMPNTFAIVEKNLEELKLSLDESKRCGEQYKIKIVDQCEVLTRWNPPKLSAIGERSMEYYNETIGEIYDNFRAAMKSSRRTDELMQQTLELEGKRVESYYQEAIECTKCLDDHLKELVKCYNKWLNIAKSVLLKAEKLSDYLKSVDQKRDSSIKQSMEAFKELIRSISQNSYPTSFYPSSVANSSDSVEMESIQKKNEELNKIVKEVESLMGSDIFSEIEKMRSLVTRIESIRADERTLKSPC